MSVIWLLATMVLAAAAFTLWVDGARDKAVDRQQQVDARIRSSNLFHQVLFTYMTGKQGVEGVAWPGLSAVATGASAQSVEDFFDGAVSRLTAQTAAGFMKMNGRVLDAGDGLRVMIQDRAGLIGLSFINKASVFSVLSDMGAETVSARQLSHALADYQDHDDLRRVSGGEAYHYKEFGLPAPANGFLRTPLQLRSVLHWEALLRPLSDAWLLQRFKADGNAAINVNTAQNGAIELVASDLAVAQKIISERKGRLFYSIFDIPSDAQGAESSFFSIMPSGGLRFWSWHTNHPVAQVYDVQFDPLVSGQNSWIVNWTTRVVLPDEMAQRAAVKINHPFFHSSSSSY